jgi:probable HAF family extracellular repeat protein
MVAIATTTVVGQATAQHAFLYSGGVTRDLGTLGGASWAVAINNAGQVVRDRFLYSDGVTTDLGALGGSWSEAQNINNSGRG